MAKKNKLYITTMYRWGNRECHSYIIYAGGSKHTAITAGEKESSERGGKYDPEVLEFEKNETLKPAGQAKVVYGKVTAYMHPDDLCVVCKRKK